MAFCTPAFTLGDTMLMASDGPKVEPMRSAYLR